MPRFIEAESREQTTLFPERLEDYIDENNPVRALEFFVDRLDLEKIGLKGMKPKATGRPSYHPSMMLKLYIYGYLNRVQSTRRLEKEAGRNLELMWLLGKLCPDFKTIANFRRHNGKPIQKVCTEFVKICRQLNMFTQALVAIDGSKFKACNNRDNNFTPAKMTRRIEEIELSIERYFAQMDRVDKEEPNANEQTEYLENKITSLKTMVDELKELEQELFKTLDKQISLNDPNARSMHLGGSSIVGYNVQAAVDAGHHLIVAHEVVMKNTDHIQLYSMASKVREGMGLEKLEVIADKGYYKGEEIKDCEDDGIADYVPKTRTSSNKARGQYDRSAFHYIAEEDVYRCPAGEILKWRQTTQERGMNLHRYWSSNCQGCHLKPQCTTGAQRRVARWEHEEILEKAERRLAREPGKMQLPSQTVEHPMGTLKHWMGVIHFQTITLEHVSTEMSLHVLAYNMKRVMNILGVKALIEEMMALFCLIYRWISSQIYSKGFSNGQCY